MADGFCVIGNTGVMLPITQDCCLDLCVCPRLQDHLACGLAGFEQAMGFRR